MLFNDSAARTVRLTLKYAGGNWALLDGNPLPAIKDGAVATLTIDAYEILDDKAREALLNDVTMEFLEKGSSLWASINPQHTPKNLYHALASKRSEPPRSGAFVEFKLDDDLLITMRPNKPAKLEECQCSVPGLDTKATSVNHAYTLISTDFEPHRRSHTGNVFQVVYFEDGNCLRPLEVLRNRTLAELEAQHADPANSLPAS